ncbi:MAG: hypothetical protein AAF628_17045 [Planctomycetota bacterium]
MFLRNLAPYALSLPLLVACGGDSHASVSEALLGVVDEIASVVEGISDKASAEAARPVLEQLGERMVELQNKAKALGKPDEATNADLESKRTNDPRTKRLQAAMMRAFAKPEAAKVLSDVMSKFPMN